MTNKIKVVELFAGVGGFRIGLEGWKGLSPSSAYQRQLNTPYQIVWSNQWEPATKKQHASMVYENRWGTANHSNQDIATVEVNSIPDHDLLVGGFPCQDYSVATTLKNSKGLIGKKGVLWWSIHKILSEKEQQPNYLFLENVDRLLISPSKQRGRDFAIILQSLNDLGYAVEWRVINAAEYGMPQRRRRVFILAYLKNSVIHKEMLKKAPLEWLLSSGTIARAFPAIKKPDLATTTLELKGDIVAITQNFNKEGAKRVFENTGMMMNGKITTLKTIPNYNGPYTLLKDVLQTTPIPPEFFLKEADLERWKYLKGAKREMRKKASGFEYFYTEGAMIFPDPLTKASRTIITGEGGKSPSRFKHVVQTKKGLRRLTPIELERLNMFPDNHTQLEKITAAKQAFFMGNALVIGVIEKIGKVLSQKILGNCSAEGLGHGAKGN